MRAITPAPIAALSAVLAALEAAGEGTRLRLLALLAEAELTVTELVTILGQSQPRVSRHLKLMVEAGLIERHREGAWAFFLLNTHGAAGGLACTIVERLDRADPVLAADFARLAEVRAARAQHASRYFAAQAGNWDAIRSLHVPEARVEAALRGLVGKAPLHAFLDLGTGTGRMLELIAPVADRAVGVDQSPAMLGLARARVEAAGLRHVSLRQGDIYAVPVERGGYDLALVHQVLHFLDDPARALREAARTLRPGGRLIVIDFAPHAEEFLRAEHAHRRLGFAREEVEGFLRDAGLEAVTHQLLTPAPGEAGKLTVSLWLARDRRVVSDALPMSLTREVA